MKLLNLVTANDERDELSFGLQQQQQQQQQTKKHISPALDPSATTNKIVVFNLYLNDVSLIE